ncbi:MAG TPA: YdeI/OmpD-associated family protein [Rariglobus sp.]|nr:YdeI/OmpD-associated family protein [Rariglobus sp.]
MKTQSRVFSSTVVRLETGMRYHALPVPEDVAAKFKAAGVRRLVAVINGHTCKRALQNHADGGSFIIVGGDLLKTCGLKLRSAATVSLTPDPEPDALDMPEAFALVLEQDDEARARWETFPIGRQRSLLHYISSAKQEATQIKRSWELAEKIRTHTLYGDKSRPS